MAMTDAQRQSLEQIRVRAEELLASGEWNPNADEVYIAANDLGEKAAQGASTLVTDVLTAVSNFLHKLG